MYYGGICDSDKCFCLSNCLLALSIWQTRCVISNVQHDKFWANKYFLSLSLFWVMINKRIDLSSLVCGSCIAGEIPRNMGVTNHINTHTVNMSVFWWNTMWHDRLYSHQVTVTRLHVQQWMITSPCSALHNSFCGIVFLAHIRKSV